MQLQPGEIKALTAMRKLDLESTALGALSFSVKLTGRAEVVLENPEEHQEVGSIPTRRNVSFEARAFHL